MGIKKLAHTIWTIDHANEQTQHQFDADYWSFLVKQVNYDEVTWDAQKQAIVFAEFIPLKSLLEDVLNRISTDNIAVTQCQTCQKYVDYNQDEGIFGDSEDLAHFICKPCAQSLSAWDFYQHHLKM